MSRVKKPRKPFKLYDLPYDSQADFDREVFRRAQQTYLPQLQDVQRQSQSESRATAGRRSDISGYTSAWQDELNKAYDQANSALNQLVGSSGTNDESRAILNAATAAQGRVSDTAQRLGAEAPPGSAAPAQAIAQGQTASGNYLGGLAENIMAGANQFRNTVPQALQTQELSTEARRHAGKAAELSGAHSDIINTIGPAREAARKDLLDQALRQRAQQYQEIVGNKELGLKSRGLDIQAALGFGGLDVQKQQLEESRRQFDWSKYVDRTKLDQQQQQLDNAANQAAGQSDEADRTAMAELFSKGATAVDSFLAADKNKDWTTTRKKVKGKARDVQALDQGLYRRNRSPDQLYAILKRIGLPENMILQQMDTVRLPGFHAYVKKRKGGFNIAPEATGGGSTAEVYPSG